MNYYNLYKKKMIHYFSKNYQFKLEEFGNVFLGSRKICSQWFF